MHQAVASPRRVRCNRGLGWTFWLIMGVVSLMTLLAMAGARDLPTLGALGIGAFVAALFVLLRVLAMPRLEILVAQGALRTRRRTVPFSAIAGVRFANEFRAGVWATFTADDGTTVARMSLADTLCAVPTAEQWDALRLVIRGAGIARGVSPGAQPSEPGRWAPPSRAVDLLANQVAWCRAGRRSSSRHAPATALRSHTVALRSVLPR